MYVIPVAYYVVKPDGGLQQSGPRIEVVGNQATLRHDQGQQGYYYEQQQQQAMQKYNQQQQQGYYNGNYYPQQQGWGGGGYPGYTGYPQQQQQQQGYYPQQNQQQGAQNPYPGGAGTGVPTGFQPGYYHPQHHHQQPQPYPQNYVPPSGGKAIVPAGQSKPQQFQQPQQPPYQPHQPHQQQQVPSQHIEILKPQPPPPHQDNRRPVTPTRPASRPGSRPGSRSGSLERQRQPSRTGEMQIEIPGDGQGGIQGPLSAGSLPPSYGPSPRQREFREAMEQPVRSPPPRQLFELPWDPKKEPNPPQNIRHVHPKDLVPPEVIQMYSGRHDHQQPPPPQQPQFDPHSGMVHSGSQPNFSRSSSLRRSQQQQYYDEVQRRRGQQQSQQPTTDLVKTHLNLANSREHLGPPGSKHHKQPRPTQHYAEPIHSHQPGAGQETAHLVRHIPQEEAARLPQELFEEKQKWQPMRPEKFSIFGKEAAYPPFPVIGPRYMISVSGGAKLIEILLSIAVLVLVTIICDRGRCFPRSYNPMATEVTMWIVAGCAIVGTVFLCVPYARKKPLSPKAYYRFLLVEVILDALGAFSYFVASICLLVVREREIIGYLIETWVCAAALGFLCGVMYVCSTVFAYLALQRARYYLHFLRYAAHRHKEDAASVSYRMSVAPNPPPQHNAAYSRPPTMGGGTYSHSGSTTLSRYN